METSLSAWSEKEEKEKKAVPPDSKVLNRKTSVNLTEYARQSWRIANLSDDYFARTRKRKREDEMGKNCWRFRDAAARRIPQMRKSYKEVCEPRPHCRILFYFANWVDKHFFFSFFFNKKEWNKNRKSVR